MRLSLLPPELLGVLLATFSFNARPISGSAAVNVALQASFNAPPFILELLFVTSVVPEGRWIQSLTYAQGNSR